MLAARLLAVAGSGGSVVIHTPPEDDEDVLVIRLTNTTNYTVTAPQDPSLADADPLTFDTAFDDYDGVTTPSGCWTIGDPTKITLTRDVARCTVEVHLTTLGTGYTGPSNQSVLVAVVKNWDGTGVYLDKVIAGNGPYDYANGSGARAIELSQFVGDLSSGDVLQVVVAGNAGTLLIEANPSGPPPSGTDYTAETGTGVIGSHFVLRGT